MANEIVYADLNLPGSQLAKSRSFHSCPRWHQIALRVGGAGHIVLLLAVVVLSILVFRSQTTMPRTAHYLSEAATQRPGNGSACNASLENMMHCLKSRLCQAEPRQLEGETTDPSNETECKLCPRDWLPHRKKCYKAFDQTQRTWNESKEECTKKGAQMLVLHDEKEKAYIANMLKPKNSVWIGLQFNLTEKKWMWVNGSPLPKNCLNGPSAAESQQCGTLKKNQLGTDLCSTKLTWICQKEALII